MHASSSTSKSARMPKRILPARAPTISGLRTLFVRVGVWGFLQGFLQGEHDLFPTCPHPFMCSASASLPGMLICPNPPAGTPAPPV